MNHLEAAITNGLRRSLRPGLVIPLYIFSLILGLLQTWPLFGSDLNRPFLNRLASGGTDIFVDLVIAHPETAVSNAGQWVVGLFVLLALFSLAYNFCAGGALARMTNGQHFWSGCLRTFLSYCVLGALLIILSIIALGLSALLYMLSTTAMLIVAIVMLLFINLFGEYARAIAFARNRLNPFVLLGQAIGFCIVHPGTWLLAVVGLLIQIGIAFVVSSTINIGIAALIIQQLAILLNLWLKQLRLAWALSYVQANDTPDQPMTVSF